jgi:hypothetical protein
MGVKPLPAKESDVIVTHQRAPHEGADRVLTFTQGMRVIGGQVTSISQGCAHRSEDQGVTMRQYLVQRG